MNFIAKYAAMLRAVPAINFAQMQVVKVE